MRILKRLALFLAVFVMLAAGILAVRGFAAERVSIAEYDAKKDADRYLSLPYSGENFTANSLPGYGAGRYYLKGRAAATVTAAYASLAKKRPDTVYLYGEMGWNGGGRFYPHRTHREGMSADFMTPVYKEDSAGNRVSVPLPCNPANLWGYGIRVGADGHFEDYRVDFPAMIAHLVALSEAGKLYGVRVKRVIFDPPLLSLLKKDPAFKNLGGMVFMKKQAWFPHDGHYHVDFTK